MSLRSKRTAYIFIIFAAFAIILNIVANYSVIGGDWQTIATVFTQLLPYLGFMAIGLYWGVNRTSGMIGTSLLFGLVGVCNAALFYNLNTLGIWIDAWIDATTTITDIMAVTVILWVVFGFLIGARQR